MVKKRKKMVNDVMGKSSGDINNHEGSGCAETKDDNIDLGIIQTILDESFVKGGGNESGKPDGSSINSSLIPILQKAQEAYGYIPRSVLNEISKRSGIATSKIYGIVTFYDQFSTERRGKYTVKTCSGTACQVRGGKKSLETVKKKLGIGVGETTEDYQFSVETAGCLGACATAPAMLINKQLYGRATEEKIVPILDQYSSK
ncbi:MAG: NADH-quinone oxidoreductase subunit NuoE family protein [Candidatus Anammoxibacter sp.]